MFNDEYMQEQLTILAEECAEVIQAISKIKRFGALHIHNGMDGIEQLETELGDVHAIIENLSNNQYIDRAVIIYHAGNKHRKLKKYTRWLPGGFPNPESVLGAEGSSIKFETPIFDINKD